MPTCEYCGTPFKNIRSLDKHRRKAKYCQEYRDISFICQKCNHTTKDIRALKEHTSTCTGEGDKQMFDSLPSRVLRLEDQKNLYQRRSEELQEHVRELNESLLEMRVKLKLERLKNNIFSQVITSHTKINVAELYHEDEDGVHVYNIENGSIPIIVHDHIKGSKGQTKKYTISAKNRDRSAKTGKTYRTVKNRVELAEEKPEELEEKIKKVEETFDEIVQQNFDVPYKETLKEIEVQIKEIAKGRVYTKNLKNIKGLRSKLLGKINMEEYVKLLHIHLDRLTIMFKNKKKRDRDIIPIVAKMLTPLDQRLLFHGHYYNTSLEADDIQRLKLSLKVNMDYPKRYLPFDRVKSYEKFHNYSIAVYPIRDTVKRILVNPYGFSNLVYLDLPKSKDDDPYSFYSLEKVEKDGRRCWKLEIRLDDFSRHMARHIKQYCISVFRRIYFDIFSDNTYREDYVSKAPICQQDCEQLLHNALDVSKSISFCCMMRKLIVKHCTIQPTELDKFNLTADDSLQKRQFNHSKDDEEDLTNVVKQLFDGISDEEARDVWAERFPSA